MQILPVTGRSVRGRTFARCGVAALALTLAGCASATPPPRFAAKSPADPGAPEAAPAADRRALIDDATAPPKASPETSPSGPPTEPHMDHSQMEMKPMEMKVDTGSAMSSPTPTPAPASEALSAEYTCQMHPEVKQGKPGMCPICGMKLVKKATTPKRPRS